KCRWYEHSIVGSATGFDGNANRNFARLRVRNPCPKRCSDMIAGINEKHPAESVEDEIARCQRIVFCNVRFDNRFLGPITKLAIGRGWADDKPGFCAAPPDAFNTRIKLRKNIVVPCAGPKPSAQGRTRATPRKPARKVTRGFFA